MRVTIIGTGNMARGIAARLLAGGHEVTLLGHESGKAGELARELGGSAGAGVAGEPIRGDVVVLAVPYEAAAPVLRQYGEEVSGKVVVDITNPVDWQTFDGLVTPPDSSAAEDISKSVPEGARVVKAFNTTFAGTLVEGQVSGQPPDVLIAGDDGEAKEAVAQLVRDGGLLAVDAAPGAAAGGPGLSGDDAAAAAGVELSEHLEARELADRRDARCGGGNEVTPAAASSRGPGSSRDGLEGPAGI